MSLAGRQEAPPKYLPIGLGEIARRRNRHLPASKIRPRSVDVAVRGHLSDLCCFLLAALPPLVRIFGCRRKFFIHQSCAGCDMTAIARRLFLAVILAGSCPLLSKAEESPSGIDPSLIIEQVDVANDGDVLMVPVEVFGQSEFFILDTGSPLMRYDKSLRRHLGTPTNSVNTSSPKGKELLELFDSPQAQVGGVSLQTDLPVSCRDLSGLKHICLEPVRGIIGMGALQRLVLQMDFDSGKLLFLKSVPEDVGIPFQISQRRPTPTVQVEIEGHGREEFAIDTGAAAEEAGTLNADLALALARKEIASESGAYKLASDNSPNSPLHRSLRIRGLRLGPYQMIDVPMSVGGSKGPNVLGMGFWSRFIVTFDFPNKMLYLKKAKHFDRPFRSNLGGLIFWREDGEVVVDAVLADGPSAKSGIQPKDILVEVGDHEARSTRLYTLYKAFGVPNSTVHVKLKRGNDLVEIDVKLPGE